MSVLLQLNNVTHFYGKLCALRDVNLTLESGAIGLVGQNGAGKSTLMQVLLGMIRPTKGSASVLGHEVAQAGLRLRGRVGYMPERECLVPGLHGIAYVALAGELCGMPRRQALRRAHETLSYLGMEDARYRRVEQYSVGMTQRLKLAATLVHDPDLLLLDEPTAGLDPDGRTAMLALLRALAARPGKSLMLSTHLLGDIEHVCSSVVILNQGRVISAGGLSELGSVRKRCFLLSWEGDGDEFLSSLQESGVQLQSLAPRRTRAVVSNSFRTQTFFQAASKHDVLLTSVEPEEENLEGIYMRLIETAGSAMPAENESAL